ncbi:MAG: hypothetical protein QXD69_04495 [Candidatus Bathyarchaeia archaeon]
MTLGYSFSNLASIHYAKPEVISEILEFSKNRWVAVYYTDGSFHRYTTYGSPLTLRSSEDLEKIRVSKGKHLRTIYASAKVYRKISIKWES